MRVILATDKTELNEWLIARKRLEVVAEVQYREALPEIIRKTAPDAVLLSILLPGTADFRDILFQVRAADVRVVVLTGPREHLHDPLFADLVAMGIYDFLPNPVRVEEIEDQLLKGATFGEAVRLLRLPTPPPAKGFLKSLRRFIFSRKSAEQETVPPVPEPDQLPEPDVKEPVTTETTKRKDKNNTGIASPGPAPEVKDAAPVTPVHKAKPVKPQCHQMELQPALAARVWLVVGAGQKVGSTACLLGLAAHLQKEGENVTILDAGGGAMGWLGKGEEMIPTMCREPVFAAVPGMITLVDAGGKMPDDILPLAEAVFVVTDMGRESVDAITNWLPGRTYLVGARGAIENQVMEVAQYKGVKYGCTLPNDVGVKRAESKGVAPRLRSWQKELKLLTKDLKRGV